MRVRRWLVLAVLALLLTVPAAAGASWTQAGYEGARTFRTPDPGPTNPAVAFEANLPGSPGLDIVTLSPQPLIHDGHAYVAVHAVDDAPRPLDLEGVARVNLSSAEVDRFVDLGENRRAGAIAIAEPYLLQVTGASLDAYSLSTGELAWSTPHPETFPDPVEGVPVICTQPAVRQGSIVYGCTVRSPSDQWEAFLVERELADGARVDAWSTAEDRRSLQPDGPSRTQVPILTGVSAIGDRFFASMLTQTGSDNQGLASAWRSSVGVQAFGYQDDQLVHLWNKTETYHFAAAPGDADEPIQRSMVASGFKGMSLLPTGGTELYARTQDQVLAMTNRETPPPVHWDETIGEEDVDPSGGGFVSASAPLASFALGDESVYTASSQTLYRFDRATGANPWQFTLDPALDQRFTNSGLVLAGGTLYAGGTSRAGNGTTIYAVDVETGQVDWRRHLPTNGSMGATASSSYGDEVTHWHSVADGALVAAGRDASLWVLGETPASIDPSARVGDRTPGVGAEVSVDLSATEPGVHGPATRYRADWGDGNTTEWQTDPVLTHRYDERGEVTARFWVAGEDNQTAVTTQTFDVGATEPNWIEERFQKENQDMTFGILGLAVALGGGAIGVARRKRKQTILQEELDALEQGFENTRDQPSECEALLDNRKARARSLALDGKLDEQQVGIVESRAEELRAELRVDALEERFGFLPYSLVTKARQMVEDGTVTALERDAFLRAVEEDDVLTSEQKALVRERIEQWFARDAGGDGA